MKNVKILYLTGLIGVFCMNTSIAHTHPVHHRANKKAKVCVKKNNSKRIKTIIHLPRKHKVIIHNHKTYYYFSNQYYSLIKGHYVRVSAPKHIQSYY